MVPPTRPSGYVWGKLVSRDVWYGAHSKDRTQKHTCKLDPPYGTQSHRHNHAIKHLRSPDNIRGTEDGQADCSAIPARTHLSLADYERSDEWPISQGDDVLFDERNLLQTMVHHSECNRYMYVLGPELVGTKLEIMRNLKD